MEKYFTILFASLVISCLCAGENYDNLKKLLSREDTLNWLKSVEMHNNSSPYCRLCCVNITAQTIGKNCGAHTLCKFESNRTGPTCKGYVNVLFTSTEKLAILDTHNTLRNKLALGVEIRGSPGPQPAAANMRSVSWSDELALIAERWAAQCVFGHDKCRDIEQYPVGQNLARGNLATNNELSLVGEWYDEVREFNSSQVNNYQIPVGKDPQYARYTQMVWADTYQIGCARAIFQQYRGSEITYVEHLICNYGPTGNIPTQPVYKVGRACSSCPEGTLCSMEYQGLCENAKDPSQSRKISSKTSKNKCSVILLVSVYLFYIFYLYHLS